MDPIYVFGHKNPDTDSIVSAMAYAALRNAIGDREFQARRLGSVSDETQDLLDRFGLEAPPFLPNTRTQICDLQFDTPPALNGAVTIHRAWQELQRDHKIATLPITDEDGRLYGMLTRGDIASFDMYSIEHPAIDNVPVFNLMASLEGRILNDTENVFDALTGEVLIAMPVADDRILSLSDMSIVLCGEQPDVVRRAIDAGARAVILCQSACAEVFMGVNSDTCIITTPYDAYKAARMLYQSIPVERVCHTTELVRFHINDYVDDVREQMLQSRFRAYPIVDDDGKVCGTLSRYHLIRPKRKRAVLVDHNEATQSVSGLEQTEIVEIIDHHRLADVQTGYPIYFRNEPVGATCTIIGSMYQEKGLMPPTKLAGLMAAAIVSDTVMFKSPTCTQRDIRMAERMARISGESLEALGYSIFSKSTSEDRSAKELIFQDYKEFHIAGHDIGIGQVTCMDSERVLKRKDEFLDVMREAAKKHDNDMVLLMLTDVLREGTELLFYGSSDVIDQAFTVRSDDGHVFLPGIVSRKKQVVPSLSLLWG